MRTRASAGARAFALVIEVPAVLITVVMMVHVTANAVMRTYLDRPIEHTLEIVQYWYMPLIALLGFVAAQLHGQHIATDLVFAKLPRSIQRTVLCSVLSLAALLAAGCAWFGWAEAVEAQEIGKSAGISTIPAWPVYYVVPIVFGVLTVQFAVEAVRGLLGRNLELDAIEPEDVMVLQELDTKEDGR